MVVWNNKPIEWKMHPFQTVVPTLCPLGTLQQLPFHVERTTADNLPLFFSYRHDHNGKNVVTFTTVKHVYGDVDILVNELRNITRTEV
mmetsp:Transcript_100862/g.217778  ORF Transcript_100862/g.217778 Transcript_100862/m.217778 type:complete len:88 (+) Transcript_100862:108-371(+)